MAIAILLMLQFVFLFLCSYAPLALHFALSQLLNDSILLQVWISLYVASALKGQLNVPEVVVWEMAASVGEAGSATGIVSAAGGGSMKMMVRTGKASA
jgi:hypothetical protein